MQDGSKVLLKPASLLRVAGDFNNNDRKVTLSGNAYFEIAANRDKPFVIYTNKASIKVVGTKFMVYASQQSPEQEVTVTEGIVTFQGEGGDKITLRKGDKGIYHLTEERMSKSRVSLDNVLAWRDKKLVFKSTTMDEVIDVVEKYFDISISVKDPRLLQCKFTSTFEQPEVNEVMEALSVALNIDVVKVDGQYSFNGEGCR